MGDDSLSVYTSTIRPISSGWIKSCTTLINPLLTLFTSAPARVPHLNIFQTFQMISLVIFVLLRHCLLLPFAILSACMCLLFHFAFFFRQCVFLDLSLQSSFLSPPSPPIFCPSVIVITARSLKVWPSRYINCAILFCRSPLSSVSTPSLILWSLDSSVVAYLLISFFSFLVCGFLW